jgi:hypothetical protein
MKSVGMAQRCVKMVFHNNQSNIGFLCVLMKDVFVLKENEKLLNLCLTPRRDTHIFRRLTEKGVRASSK